MSFTPEELHAAERSSIALTRELAQEGAEISPGEQLSIAQIIMLLRESSSVESSRSLYTEDSGSDLIVAARLLDAIASIDNEDEDAKRAAHFVAAACFAMQGNFPSALAVLLRLDSQEGLSPIEVVLYCLCVPSRREQFGDLHRLPPEYQKLIVAQDSFLTGNAEARDFHQAFIEFAPRVLSRESAFYQSLLDAMQLAIRQNIRLSTYRCLTKHCGENLSREYILSLINGGTPTLLPTQYVAAKKGLITSLNNAIISVPTSTGKTLISELCAISSLQNHGLACILTPYIALGRQVANSIKQHTKQSGIRVHNLTGGVELESALNPERFRELVVATPERIDALFRSRPGLLDALRCMVIDESHLIENGSRGIRLEGLIARLRIRQTSISNSFRLVLVSAVLPQDRSIETWLGEESERFTYSWRPTARRIAIWRLGGNLQYFIGDDPLRLESEAADTPIGARSQKWESQPRAMSPNFGAEKKEREKLNQSVAAFAVSLIENRNPILCVCATRENSRSLARSIAERLPEIELTDRLKSAVELIDEKYPFYRPLRKMLTRGVAYHNSAVPPPLRVAIEEATKNRELRIVAATTTLAEGVDLPFRYTLIVDWLTFSAQKKKTPIKGQLLKNIAGRCGRAGVYTEGDTIIVENPIGDAEFTAPGVRSAVMHSVIFKPTDKMGSAIGEVVGEDNEEGHAALSSQILAAIQENPGEDDLAEVFAQNTYSGISRGDRVLELVNGVIQELLSADGGLPLAERNSPLQLTAIGMAANRSGLSAASAREAISFLQEDLQFLSLPELSAHILRRFGSLPEQPNSNVREMLHNPRSHFPVKPVYFEKVTYDWIRGVPPHESFATLPHLLRSSRDVKVAEWSAGIRESLDWETVFDKYAEFLTSQYEEYLPRLMVSFELFSGLMGGWGSQIDWRTCRESLQERKSYWI